MAKIEKKISKVYFDDVNIGLKTFELRRDEDNVQVGDYLILKEWDGHDFTGRKCTKRVKYVLRNYEGLEDGYCIIGIE